MSTPSHEKTGSELAHLFRVLKTPRLPGCYEHIATQATEQSWTYEQYLAAVLSVEASAREASGTRMRIKRAGFPQLKTLEDFDFTAQPGLDRARIARLETSGWVSQGHNVIFLGPPGTGKTHLATGLGIIAARHGYRVGFDTAAGWINQLNTAHNHGQLEKTLKKLDRYQLLIIDELGYVPIEAEAANLFFQLVARRYERASIIITSNPAFSRWGECFTDTTVAAAKIDRLVHHAEIFTHEGTSYRINGHTDVLPPTSTDTGAVLPHPVTSDGTVLPTTHNTPTSRPTQRPTA